MKIADLMTSSPDFLTPDETVFDAAQLMAEDDVGIIPVCESRDTRRLLGCITDRDIVCRVVAKGWDPQKVSCGEVMSQDLVTCKPDDSVDEAEKLMKENQLRRILVADENNSLLGVISTADIARERGKAEVGETLQSISQPTPTPSGV